MKTVIARLRNTNISEIFIHMETFDKHLTDELDNRFVVKVPWVTGKYEVAVSFKKAGFRVCATAVYTIEQFLSSIALGVDYVAFYFDRSKRKGLNPSELLSRFVALSRNFSTHPTLIVASLKDLDQLIEAIDCGVSHFTLPVQLFEKLLRTSEIAAEDAAEFSRDFAKLSKEVN
nr:transaldolase family protein [Thermotoga sp. Ku-13t]